MSNIIITSKKSSDKSVKHIFIVVACDGNNYDIEDKDGNILHFNSQQHFIEREVVGLWCTPKSSIRADKKPVPVEKTAPQQKEEQITVPNSISDEKPVNKAPIPVKQSVVVSKPTETVSKPNAPASSTSKEKSVKVKTENKKQLTATTNKDSKLLFKYIEHDSKVKGYMEEAYRQGFPQGCYSLVRRGSIHSFIALYELLNDLVSTGEIQKIDTNKILRKMPKNIIARKTARLIIDDIQDGIRNKNIKAIHKGGSTAFKIVYGKLPS